MKVHLHDCGIALSQRESAHAEEKTKWEIKVDIQSKRKKIVYK